jgi:polycystin 1L2
LSNDNVYNYFLNNQLTTNHQSLIFGLREFNSTEFDTYCSNSSINRTIPISDEPVQFASNYQLRVYTSGCYYLNTDNQWKSDGLIVGSLTNHNETECYSTHLTTFAGGFLVLPSPINWNYVFANSDFKRNLTIYLTIICISILYMVLTIYARYKDKKDVEKLGVRILNDNYVEDQYCYEIIVLTGHRKDSGTKSKVQFVICGVEDETKVRTFSHSNREIFQRGGIDAFIMTVPK